MRLWHSADSLLPVYTPPGAPRKAPPDGLGFGVRGKGVGVRVWLGRRVCDLCWGAQELPERRAPIGQAGNLGVFGGG